jgi:hypothetical protein
MNWTTPEEIAGQVLRRWSRGDILAARLNGGPTLFPMEVRLRRPGPKDIADRFGEVQEWVTALAVASRRERGFDLVYETVRNRVQGTNQLPIAAIIPSEASALRLIGQESAFDRFQRLADITLTRHDALRHWLARCPLTALEHADRWDNLLDVLDWFVAHPRPGVFLRQLDIPGVDTKFIEEHRPLLSELLDIVLPPEAVDDTVSGVAAFAQRYGLRSETLLVRFRALDRACDVSGLSDLSLPPEQFAGLNLRVRRVFITENRTNGLAFPDHPDSIVIFGLGYGLDRLARIGWLRDVDVHYWGDIDTHGFGILNRLRVLLPQARSLLMDRATLDTHRDMWGQEVQDACYLGDVSRLLPVERALYEDLRFHRLGERVRLEQERIGYRWVEQALDELKRRA